MGQTSILFLIGLILSVLITFSAFILNRGDPIRKDWLVIPFIWFAATAVSHYIGG